MPGLTKVAQTSEIQKGSAKIVEVDGKTIAIFNCDGTLYATDNTCRHQGGPLGEGSLSGTTVTCPWHGWKYDVATGASTMNPSITVQTFDVKVEGEDVFLSL